MHRPSQFGYGAAAACGLVALAARAGMGVNVYGLWGAAVALLAMQFLLPDGLAVLAKTLQPVGAYARAALAMTLGAIVYALVIIPVALFRRLFGHRRIHQILPKTSASYWSGLKGKAGAP